MASQQSNEGPVLWIVNGPCAPRRSGQRPACVDRPASKTGQERRTRSHEGATASPRSSSGVTEPAKAEREADGTEITPEAPRWFYSPRFLMGAAAASRDDRTNSAWAPHPPRQAYRCCRPGTIPLACHGWSFTSRHKNPYSSSPARLRLSRVHGVGEAAETGRQPAAIVSSAKLCGCAT